MGVNLPTFLGLRQDFGHGWTAGNNSNEITAREIFDAAMGGSGGASAGWQSKGGLPALMKYNARKNVGMIAMAVIATPIMFKVGTKLLRKPILTPANRLLKSAGLTGVKV